MNKKNQSDELSFLSKEIIHYETQIIEDIRKRLGILIHSYQLKELHKTILSHCVRKNYGVSDYVHHLKTDPEDTPLLENLITAITIGETYFFRDKQQMKLLQKVILPELIQKKRAQKQLSLRIWSAGCATGEEIYTICMLLTTLLPDLPKWRLQLLGTDLNTNALQKAITGVYSKWSMRAIGQDYKTRFFNEREGRFFLSAKIRDMVHFEYLNLHANGYPSLLNGTNAQDLILCRNVLIYFDREFIGHLMKKLSQSLIYGGFLILGASDPIVIEETDLVLHSDQGIVFSRPLPKKTEIKTPLQFTQIEKPIYRPKQQTNIHHKSVHELLSEGQWEETIRLIAKLRQDKGDSSRLLTAEATAFANLGQLNNALMSCEKSLKIDMTNKYTYFTYGLTLAELDRMGEAETALRKALFLDHQFIMGHYQLGLLLLRLQRHRLGLKSLNNALHLIEAKNPLDPVDGYPGMNYEKLADIFKHEIAIYAK